MSTRKRKPKKLSREATSQYMRQLVGLRWAKYRKLAAEGSLPERPFKPRGPMPPRQKANGTLKRMDSAIGQVQLFNAALRGKRLTAVQIKKMAGQHRTPRRYIRTGGQRPDKFKVVRYGRMVDSIVRLVRKRFEELGIELE